MPNTASREDLLTEFSTRENGLSSAEAELSLREYGPNIFGKKKRFELIRELLFSFINPLNIVLGIICIVSYAVHEKTNALIVFTIILMSSFLSFIQEHRSIREAKKLSQRVSAKVTALRDGQEQEIPAKGVVPGDVIILRAGDMVPADVVFLNAKDLFVDESALTGESMPVEKYPIKDKQQQREITAFAGSSIVSGTAYGIVISTGERTQFGKMVAKLSDAPVQTAFDKGIQRFIWIIISFTCVLVFSIFTVNVLIKGKPVEALLFSLSVAVGLTPEMLPAIIAVTLSAGAIAMSKKKVIVKHLNAIQNLGSMDVLCSDKTGTLTENRIILEKHCDVVGKESEEVLKLAYMNSYYQAGLKNILDEAVLKHEAFDLHSFHKFDEIPFDFERRLMSVVIDIGGKHRLITKGAAEAVFQHSSHYELDGEIYELDPLVLADLRNEYEKLSSEGFRVLAVAYKDYQEKKTAYLKADEENMILKGYLAFLDPPKSDAKEIISRLERLGVRFIVMTGDDELVTKKICEEVGLKTSRVVSGKMLEKMKNEEILSLVQKETVFARLSPFQKEKIVSLLRTKGHVVGFLGDGINDAPSLKSADIGISVDNAVDIAKESADIILLEKNLLVLESGVLEGRKISGNVMKYLKMDASSNLGNMISMTAASFFLPFLPMTPVQILLNNLLYDFSQVAIPTDRVDEDYILKPRPWNMNSLKRFMIIFGSLSSVFDFLTFGVMFCILRFSAQTFQTGWFLESLATQTLVIHAIRSGKIPFIQTRASVPLILTTFMTLIIGFGVTVSPVRVPLGFRQLPVYYYGGLVLIVAFYLIMVEAVKRIYSRKYSYD